MAYTASYVASAAGMCIKSAFTYAHVSLRPAARFSTWKLHSMRSGIGERIQDEDGDESEDSIFFAAGR